MIQRKQQLLLSYVDPFVPPGVLSADSLYEECGKNVSIFVGSDEFVSARVDFGFGVYDTLIEYAPHTKQLKVDCSCRDIILESGLDQSMCVHVYATLIVAEKNNLLSAVTERGGIRGIEHFSDNASRCRKSAGSESWDEDEVVWDEFLDYCCEDIEVHQTAGVPGQERMLYIFCLNPAKQNRALRVQLKTQQRKKDGEWGVLKNVDLEGRVGDSFFDPADREITALLKGSSEHVYDIMYYGNSEYVLDNAVLADTLIPKILKTGRAFYFQSEQEKKEEKEWYFDEPDEPPVPPDLTVSMLRRLQSPAARRWKFNLEVEASGDKECYHMKGVFRSGREKRDLREAVQVLSFGWVFWEDSLEKLELYDCFSMAVNCMEHSSVAIPKDELPYFLETVYQLPSVPKLTLPEGHHVQEIQGEPTVIFRVKRNKYDSRAKKHLMGKLVFQYNDYDLDWNDKRKGCYEEQTGRFIVRSDQSERNALEEINTTRYVSRRSSLGTMRLSGYNLELPAERLPEVVSALLEKNWRVEAEGKLYRTPGGFSVSVSSGIDWFELRGECDFDGRRVRMPEILRTLRNGEKTIQLDDGSVGIIPEKWLKQLGLLSKLGKKEDDHIKFQKNQCCFLDALLSARHYEVKRDEQFSRIKKELGAFKKVKPVTPGKEFAGTLRKYQKEGLGWLYFLRRFGFGGCLADDMGLGKTVQVLALLGERYGKQRGMASKKASLPSLVVAPRSLVFNWKQEAERFSGHLSVLENIGMRRMKDPERLRTYDVILTTYGTLRRDIFLLKDMEFEYVVLDEAQAIKNPHSKVAKASRLLNAHHRLALSGTPIENHLGELWSLFEFLNPGMLGSSSILKHAKGNPGEASRKVLSRALQPFLLRRTKAKVLKELPDKFEETIYCEFEPKQRKIYNELKEHYRLLLAEKIGEKGLNQAKIHILEALLRMRQAACHPALINEKYADIKSAKLETLYYQLEEVLEEGHKALVFSQFTSFLKLVRSYLDEKRIPYEYLDGRTRDRKGRVEHFQEDPDCRLFLISLKAGGHGLNLTAADYIFLLDPWWNPAIEAQAIDRAHRIGQTRKVFAYRLVVRESVEEKILQLQSTKKGLAQSIIREDNNLIGQLRAEDLEILFS